MARERRRGPYKNPEVSPMSPRYLKSASTICLYVALVNKNLVMAVEPGALSKAETPS